MSKWVTISTPEESVTEFGVDYHELGVGFVGELGPSLGIENGVIYIPPEKTYIVSANDTSNMGTIVQPFTDTEWGVILHEDSLWTFDCYHGPSYEYKEDVLEKIPDWVKVGGNWDWMDRD